MGRLRAVGQAVGIDFTGACDRAPNSIEAHALMAFAAEVAPEKQNTLQEVLFRHYFTDGLYPAGENLAAAATEAGLDGKAALAYAQDPQNKGMHVRFEPVRNVSAAPRVRLSSVCLHRMCASQPGWRRRRAATR